MRHFVRAICSHQQKYYDDVVEFYDKCMQGLSIIEEHCVSALVYNKKYATQHDNINARNRIRLECRLYAAIESGLNHVLELCCDFKRNCHDDEKRERICKVFWSLVYQSLVVLVFSILNS